MKYEYDSYLRNKWYFDLLVVCLSITPFLILNIKCVGFHLFVFVQKELHIYFKTSLSVLKYSKHKQKQREYLFKYNPRWNFKREKRKEKHFKTKHCQRHGAFYKATTFRPHQKFFPQSWSQISFRISKNLPTSFNFSTKLHIQNSIWKYQLNFSLKILTKHHL